MKKEKLVATRLPRSLVLDLKARTTNRYYLQGVKLET